MPTKPVPESEYPPFEEWPVVGLKYPCCGRKPRGINAHVQFHAGAEKQCPRCFTVWQITFSISEWAEQPPFIKAHWEKVR